MDRFTPARTFAMGIGLFLLNPIDLSCAIAGALTIAVSGTSQDTQIVAIVVFIVLASASVAGPVLILLVRGDAARPTLRHLRTWVAGNSHVVKALLLVVIAFRQITKGLHSR